MRSFSLSAALFFAFLLVPHASHAGTPACTTAQLKLALPLRANGMTGGTLQYSLEVTNTSRHACLVEGRPLVRVSSRSYPVIVGDLASAGDRQNPLNGPEREIDLKPEQVARSSIEVWRLCAGAASELTTGAVVLSFTERTVSLPIQACRRQGAMILAGPFLVS